MGVRHEDRGRRVPARDQQLRLGEGRLRPVRDGGWLARPVARRGAGAGPGRDQPAGRRLPRGRRRRRPRDRAAAVVLGLALGAGDRRRFRADHGDAGRGPARRRAGRRRLSRPARRHGHRERAGRGGRDPGPHPRRRPGRTFRSWSAWTCMPMSPSGWSTCPTCWCPTAPIRMSTWPRPGRGRRRCWTASCPAGGRARRSGRRSSWSRWWRSARWPTRRAASTR